VEEIHLIRKKRGIEDLKEEDEEVIVKPGISSLTI
jgi:hypothetical protein